ncbi:anti-phage dCTP deaminase [Thiohalobacter thiocyanaticus]|uniref:anti-phage dCTP deaminase n=1 Tax=Thiohalobacter thiocyanaticus TaxID=585455 RepID=UPI0012FD2C2F|nr:anti-phage dCTP deaminase [Thiohalobacter thiocyanaticus]
MKKKAGSTRGVADPKRTAKKKSRSKENEVGPAPELFIGLVGAVGSDLETVNRQIRSYLKAANYKTVDIRLSRLITDCKDYAHLEKLKNGPENERIDKLMDAGDDLRRNLKRGDAVSLLGILAVRAHRKTRKGDSKEPVSRTAYIFNSLKHPDEIESLRNIYGESFFVVSTYAPKRERIESLAKRIARSKGKFRADDYENEAESLVEKDEKEVGEDYGQNVRDAFPLADVFISQRKNVDSQIKRFIELIFGHPFITPTVDEYGMFHAKAAALRSADLSRQVGAVITTDDGEMISAGCNEVPKAGGGSVWEDKVESKQDYRDFKIGQDASAVMKREIITEIFEKLKTAGWLSQAKRRKRPDKLAEDALYSKTDAPLKDTRAASIIEFGRIVHAEMSAITDAARRGLSVKDANLYCTTFPCHMCARHIVAAGMQRVVYVEPYPKSMAKDLYKRSIQVDGDEADEDAVVFEPFVGIAPIRYISLFEMPPRKDKRGYPLDWELATANPQIQETYPRYIDLEEGYIEPLFKRYEQYAATD